LQAAGHEVEAIGKKQGKVAGVPIQLPFPKFENIDTVTLYINPQHQQDYVDYLLNLNPKRVIFNPGTENEELYDQLKSKGIEVKEACTLVMLSTGQF
jgi:hypothetical protein